MRVTGFVTPEKKCETNCVTCKFSSKLCYSFKLKSKTLKLRLVIVCRITGDNPLEAGDNGYLITLPGDNTLPKIHPGGKPPTSVSLRVRKMG